MDDLRLHGLIGGGGFKINANENSFGVALGDTITKGNLYAINVKDEISEMLTMAYFDDNLIDSLDLESLGFTSVFSRIKVDDARLCAFGVNASNYILGCVITVNSDGSLSPSSCDRTFPKYSL